MRITILSFLALAAVAAPGIASADATSERAAAVQLCRAQVADQAAVSVDNVRLTGVRDSLRSLRIDVELWRNGARQNVRCEVDRSGDQPTLVSINPPIQTASAH